MVLGTDDGTGVDGAGGCGGRWSRSCLVVDDVGGGDRFLRCPLSDGGDSGADARRCDELAVGSGRLTAGRRSDGDGSGRDEMDGSVG